MSQKSVSELVALLTDEDKDVRLGAAKELEAYPSGVMEAEVKAAVPVLIRALKAQEAEVRRGAAYALGKIGVDAKAAVPALIDALKDRGGRNPGIRDLEPLHPGNRRRVIPADQNQLGAALR